MHFITVKNNTADEIRCSVYPVGLEEHSIENTILANSKHIFQFTKTYSKTYIISVNELAVRAISKNAIGCINKLSDGLLIISVQDGATSLNASPEEIIEDQEISMNWNAVKGEDEKNNSRKKASENIGLLLELNKHIANVFGMMTGAAVFQLSSSKEVTGITTKVSTDFFNNYLKASIPLLKDTEDPAVIFKLNEIRLELLAISRSISYGYPYYRECVPDTNLWIGYLQDSLSRITTANMFPFLEECSLEIAVPTYIYGICVVQNIIGLIREIRNVEASQVEVAYVKVFVTNLKEMWESVLSSVACNCDTKVRGCFIKKATLWHKGQLVYYVKSLWKRRAQKRIEDVKEGFVKNRKYQLEFLFNHPSDFVRRFEEQN